MIYFLRRLAPSEPRRCLLTSWHLSINLRFRSIFFQLLPSYHITIKHSFIISPSVNGFPCLAIWWATVKLARVANSCSVFCLVNKDCCDFKPRFPASIFSICNLPVYLDGSIHSDILCYILWEHLWFHYKLNIAPYHCTL